MLQITMSIVNILHLSNLSFLTIPQFLEEIQPMRKHKHLVPDKYKSQFVLFKYFMCGVYAI